MKHFLKNPKTYLLLIIMSPIIILGVFFFKYYPLYKNALHPFLNNSNQANVIIKNPFDDFNDFDDIEDIDIDNKVLASVEYENKIENEKNLIDDKSIVESTPSAESKNAVTNSELVSAKKSKQPSYNNIIASYKRKFEKLQSNQENNLYSLMEKGKTEYAANKDKKSSLISLGSKYLNIINDMEKQSDKEFNDLINSLKNELISNSYDTGIVREISDYYNYYKNSLRSELIQKATQQM